MNRAIVVRAVIAAVVLSVTGLGLAMEWLGNWTDAHPDRMTLVWGVWNVLALVVTGVLVWQWIRYRRAHRDNQTNPS